jgi:ankyrin repeat-rich membrane spanning protein
LESATKNGWTTLKSAADEGHVEVFRELLKHGAKLESATNNGWTTLKSAADEGHVKVFPELLKHGAKF